jgi:hypothetical protein
MRTYFYSYVAGLLRGFLLHQVLAIAEILKIQFNPKAWQKVLNF